MKITHFQNRFRHKIESKEFVLSVEINPAKDGDLSKNFREVALCAPFVDVVNVTDSSMARLTTSSFVTAALIQRKFDIDAIFNFTCRDRNAIGLKSDLLGALALGVQNVLALTGDPPQVGDHPHAKGVFEFSSSSLLRLIAEIKSPVGEFFPGAVINFSGSTENIEKIVAGKKAAGAKFLISQPVYTIGRVELLAAIQQKFDIPVIAGILPIKNRRVAEYVQNKVRGITVPEEDFTHLISLSDEEIFAWQIKKAGEIFKTAREAGLSGVHFMPMGRGDKIAEIIQYDPETAHRKFFAATPTAQVPALARKAAVKSRRKAGLETDSPS